MTKYEECPYCQRENKVTVYTNRDRPTNHTIKEHYTCDHYAGVEVFSGDVSIRFELEVKE
jgi:hypothetical protein